MADQLKKSPDAYKMAASGDLLMGVDHKSYNLFPNLSATYSPFVRT